MAKDAPQVVAVSPTNAAKMLDCSRAHIYQLIERGLLRRRRVAGSRSVRIPVADVYALIGLGPNGEEPSAPTGESAIASWIATHPECREPGRHFVYFLRNRRGQVVYVGVSSHLRQRLMSHDLRFGDEIAAVDTVEYRDRAAALAAESDAIAAMRPKHNRAGAA